VTKLLLAGLPALGWVPLSMAEGDAIGGHGRRPTVPMTRRYQR